jgi:hypothetical protein
VKRKFTLPLGVPAEMDADAGTLRLLEPAVWARRSICSATGWR